MKNREEELNPQRNPNQPLPGQPGRESGKDTGKGGGQQTPHRTPSSPEKPGNVPTSGQGGSVE